MSEDEVTLHESGPLIQYDWCCYQKRRDTELEAHGDEEHHVRLEAETGVMMSTDQATARTASQPGSRKGQVGQAGPSPRLPQREHSPADAGFQAPHLQTVKDICVV